MPYNYHTHSVGSDCEPCNKCKQPSCECSCSAPSYEDVGCLSNQTTDCTYYNDTDLGSVGVTKGNSLTQVLKKFAAYVTSLFSRVSSSTLQINRTGDNLSINLQPSYDANNALVLGTDGKPYVGLAQIDILPSTCITWQKTVQGNKITIVPIFDWNCIAQQTCPLCDNPVPCDAPTAVTTLSVAQNSIQIAWNQVGGVNYDILVNGALHQSNVVGPFTVTGLSPNNTYNIVVRAKCASGTADTSISVTTIPITSCTNPSTLTITLS